MKSRSRGHADVVPYGYVYASGGAGASPAGFVMNVARDDDDTQPRAAPALEEVFRAYHAFVYRCVRRLGVPDAQAQDVTQEVFLVVQRRLVDYEERGTIRSWLYRIAQRVVSTHLRGEARTQRRLERVVAPQPARLPDESMARREAADAVREFLAGLDEDQRMVFVLADIEGLRAAEIADAVGVGVNTVYSRLRLAREKFNAFVDRRRVREQKVDACKT